MFKLAPMLRGRCPRKVIAAIKKALHSAKPVSDSEPLKLFAGLAAHTGFPPRPAIFPNGKKSNDERCTLNFSSSAKSTGQPKSP